MTKSAGKERSKAFVVILHIALWLIFFIIPNYVVIWQEENGSHYYLFILKKTLFYVFVFYLNYSVLVPFLFFRNRKLLYFIVAAFTTFLLFMTSEVVIETTRPRFEHDKKHYDNRFKESDETRFVQGEEQTPFPKHPHRPPPRWPLTYNNLLTFFLLSGAGLGLRFADKTRETERLRREAEKEKIHTELEMLKSRIHPHFFFNTLNNIYALTESGSAEASGAILKLSRLMRYVIYDSQAETTLLSKEIDFIRNYIDLMRLRLTPKIKLEVYLPDNFSDTEIFPLLFITFVENAFKHGISYSHPSFIDISMQVGNNQIDFSCKNSLHDKKQEEDDMYAGLGLENAKKRLELLYPRSHQLNIIKTTETFEVKLIIITGNENKNAGY
jgi:hypothetical protein